MKIEVHKREKIKKNKPYQLYKSGNTYYIVHSSSPAEHAVAIDTIPMYHVYSSKYTNSEVMSSTFMNLVENIVDIKITFND